MKNFYNYLLLILLIGNLALTSCKKNEVFKNVKNERYSDTNSINISQSVKTELNENHKINDEVIDSISQWVGKYSYVESWKDLNGLVDLFLEYELEIYKKGNDWLTGNLNIDGFQTMERKKCAISYSKNSVSVFCNNELLFILKKDVNEKLKTYWKNLHPEIDKKTGKVRFVKE